MAGLRPNLSETGLPKAERIVPAGQMETFALEAAAVADVPHHGGLGAGEGGEVTGGALVQSGDAAGDIHLRQGLRTSGCDADARARGQRQWGQRLAL